MTLLVFLVVSGTLLFVLCGLAIISAVVTEILDDVVFFDGLFLSLFVTAAYCIFVSLSWFLTKGILFSF